MDKRQKLTILFNRRNTNRPFTHTKLETISMKLSKSVLPFVTALSFLYYARDKRCHRLILLNADDFDQPDWAAID
jgi:hypothetical protein